MARIKTAQDIAIYLKQARRSQGMTQQQLAEKIGVSRSWVIDAEKGKPTIELDLVLKALYILNISLTAHRIDHATSATAADSSPQTPEILDITAIEKNQSYSSLEALGKFVANSKKFTELYAVPNRIKNNKVGSAINAAHESIGNFEKTKKRNHSINNLLKSIENTNNSTAVNQSPKTMTKKKK